MATFLDGSDESFIPPTFKDLYGVLFIFLCEKDRFHFTLSHICNCRHRFRQQLSSFTMFVSGGVGVESERYTRYKKLFLALNTFAFRFFCDDASGFRLK